MSSPAAGGVPHELRSAEHTRVGTGCVRGEELADAPCRIVDHIAPPAAIPDRIGASVLDGRDHPCTRGIIQLNDIAGNEQLGQRFTRGGKLLLIEATLSIAVRAIVSLAVEVVLEKPDETEEVVVRADHAPAGVDPGSARVGDDRL